MRAPGSSRGETAVAVTHAELQDARIFGRNSIHVYEADGV
jgi:hypothetical protein